MNRDTPNTRALTRHIKLTLRLTYVGLIVERCAQAFLWFGVWACVLCTAALFGVFSILEAGEGTAAIIAVALSLAILFGLGVLRFRMPKMHEARARVDGALPNRPLQALADLPALGQGDAQTQLIWRAHQNRMAQQAWAARPIAPHVRLAERDPFALRLMALTGVCMGLLFGHLPPKLGDAQASVRLATGPIWEGWVEPPKYTGKPTLYLADMPAQFTAPLNSKVTIRLYGDENALQMRQTVSDQTVMSPADAQDFTVTQTGEIEIRGDTGRLWSVALLPDMPPKVALVGEMTRAVSGAMTQPFEMSDDFGIARAQLEVTVDRAAITPHYGYRIAPEDRPDLVLSIPVSLGKGNQDIKGVVAENLSRHPFSGLPVQVQLTAWDVIGHHTTSRSHPVILPGRRFFDPLAAALIDVRRELLWNRENATRSAQVLRAVSHAQDDQNGGDHALFLRLRAVAALIEVHGAKMSDEIVEQVDNTLWTIAIELEDGELSEALARLRRAQERLAQAMRDGATPDEIAKLMQDLRDATQDYIRQRAAQQSQDPNSTPAQDDNTRDVSADQLQQLMDRIQKLMEQGRMAEAQQLMEMLGAMLETMQVSQGQGASGQAIEGVEEMLREQQKLNDETFSELQNQFDPSNETPLGPDAGITDVPNSLADRQNALRGQAEQQGRGLPPTASEQGETATSDLDRAERAMEDAEEALRADDFASALDNQARAMEALRDGLKRLNAQSRQSGDPQEAQNGAATGQPNGQDPLGRSDGQGQGANDGSTGGDVPPQGDVYQQAEELLDEIRRRSAQRERADAELEYLKRLLDRF